MAGTSFCPECGAQTTPLTKVCTNCGAQVGKAIKGETWKPTAAGILYIIAGVISGVSGIVIATVGGIGGAFIGMGWLSAIGAPLIVLGIVAIVGGIYALRRRLWGLALAGSICALIGPWALLGILAIVFVSLGKGEFE
jgi:hypothetical protein